MKNFIRVIAVCLLLLNQQVSAQELKSEFLFDLDLDVAPPQFIGSASNGTRLIFPYKGGLVKGDKITGKILAGGGDWGLVLDSNTFKPDARATIETADGAQILVTYTGYNYASVKNVATITAGKGGELSPNDYYFRTSVSFETSAPKYAWLNHTIGVGVGRFIAAGKVSYRIYAIR
ncbi:DUF3237 domain-containing protein [Pseudoflavitalea sp. G-6-1-2]|uniref:DUF3237 domain-containing protein n=1 Tax=Pseudoflavitalea sp. G-6-1-2 TaxID=2728841 RepID=UPI00146F1421|nr:DUF3237 domain-containing protein [Pseudoflavitalea sp. G-6-1-2]NML21183.1 DUF3237 domain-containing protein [Pseudoflavitalea sp. G-6-1-2]